MVDDCLVGGWPKNISQVGWLFPRYGKIKNVPNHQLDIYVSYQTTKLWSPSLGSHGCFEIYIYIFKNWEFRVALLEEETHSLVN